MNKDPKPQDQAISPKSPAEVSHESSVYTYEPSGIRERGGYIPIWLKLVAFALMVWGIYYMIRFWSSE